jgi:putative phosphoesterase
MLIGVISDIHDHLEHLYKAVDIFKQKNVGLVINLGDFCTPKMIKTMRGLNVVGVFGNNDGEKFLLIKAFEEIGGVLSNEFYEFEQDGLKFACFHGTVHPFRDALIESGKYDVVFYGHNHKTDNRIVGKTIVLNPGTAHGFGDKATIALFDTETKKVEMLEL